MHVFIAAAQVAYGVQRVFRKEAGVVLSYRRAIRGIGAVAAEQALYFLNQCYFVDGFGQEVVHTGFAAGFFFGVHNICRKGNDRYVQVKRVADILRSRYAVHAGHLHIHQYEVERFVLQLLYSGAAVVGRVYTNAGQLEILPGDKAVHLHVVHYQNAFAFKAYGRGSECIAVCSYVRFVGQPAGATLL